jgi:hypothetical protein
MSSDIGDTTMSNRYTEIIDGAIGVLDREGWRQRGGEDGRGRCVSVALSEAAGYRWPELATACDLVVIDDLLELHIAEMGFRPRPDGLTAVVQWNDAPDRTVGDVIGLLEAVRADVTAGFTSEPGEVVEYDGNPDPLIIPEPAQDPVQMPERESEPVPA